MKRIPEGLLDKIMMTVAWWLPRRLVYWCAIRVGSYATVGEYRNQVVPDLTFQQAIDRWQK